MNDCTYIVHGPPGTGKTTYLAQKARDFVDWARPRWPESWRSSVLISSLTRAAAKEIGGRDLPIPRQQVSTLHSHAYRSLGAPEVAAAHVDEFSERHPVYSLKDEKKADTSEPEWHWGSGRRGDDVAMLYHTLRARCTDREFWPGHVRKFAHAWESWKEETGYIDFDDMIEMAYHDVPFAPGAPKILIADEAQDWSLLEYRLAKRWGRAAGHLILCGDPDQAIYTWRGADPSIFLDPEVPDDHRRVLGQSYRVPRAVQAMSMRWRDRLSDAVEIEYAPRDATGEVKKCKANWRTPEVAVSIAQEHLAEGKTVMILATCGYMIAPTVAVLRKRLIPFANPWRRKRGDWNPLSRGRGTSMAERILALVGVLKHMWTRREVYQWMHVMASKKGLRPGAKKAIKEHREDDLEVDWDWVRALIEADALQALLDRVWAEDVKGIEGWWHGRLLKRHQRTAEYPHRLTQKHGPGILEEEPRCYIGTIHSFKGAEADTVILFPDLSPAGWRQWRSKRGRDAVVRLFYVGLTRARESLYLCRATGRGAPLGKALT